MVSVFTLETTRRLERFFINSFFHLAALEQYVSEAAIFLPQVEGVYVYKEKNHDGLINEENAQLVENFSKWMHDTLSAFMVMFSIQPNHKPEIEPPFPPHNSLLTDFLHCFREIHQQTEIDFDIFDTDQPDIGMGMDLLHEDLAKMQDALDDIRNSLSELYTLDTCVEYLQMAFLSVMQNYIFRQMTDISTQKQKEIGEHRITALQTPTGVMLH